MDSRFHRNDSAGSEGWIPVFTRMTGEGGTGMMEMVSRLESLNSPPAPLFYIVMAMPTKRGVLHIEK